MSEYLATIAAIVFLIGFAWVVSVWMPKKIQEFLRSFRSK